MIEYVNQCTLREAGLDVKTASQAIGRLRLSIHSYKTMWEYEKTSRWGKKEKCRASVITIKGKHAIEALRNLIDTPYNSRVNVEKWERVIKTIEQ